MRLSRYDWRRKERTSSSTTILILKKPIRWSNGSVQLGRRSAAFQADLSNLKEVQALLQQSIRELGKLDILVNNAGVEKHADFWDVSEADYDLVMHVNLKGVFFVTQGFVRHLMENKRPGKVINMSSVHEELPFPHFAPYCMSKGGMRMMTRDLAIELAPYGITIDLDRAWSDRNTRSTQSCCTTPPSSMRSWAIFLSSGWASHRTWPALPPFSRPRMLIT